MLLDPDKVNRVNKAGVIVGNVVGSYQKFAIQNITGTYTMSDNAGASNYQGAFYMRSISNIS